MDKQVGQNAIGIEEFAKLLEEASAAFEHNDIVRALAINHRLLQVGYSLVICGGGLQIQNQTIPQVEAASRPERWG